MEFEDRIRIATPEGVDLELTLAGLGSRFVAQILDFLIQLALAVAVVVGLGTLGGYGDAVVFIAIFAIIFLYQPFFELIDGGRSPGKRWTGLRVLMEGGEAVGVRASAVRNVIRILDFLPLAYLIGSIAILVTGRNQRLGDLAADTIVVRERRATATKQATTWLPAPVLEAPASEAWDVSAISAGELAAVRSFLQRRQELTVDARNHLARELVRRLQPKVAGVQPGVEGERFLETLAAAKGGSRVSASAPAPVELSGKDAVAGSLVLLAAALARPLLGHPPAPSCPLRALTGIPCPLCGMTTGVEATVHGHPLAAVAANPLAPVLVAAALYALARRPSLVTLPRWGVALAIGAAWLFELGRFGVVGWS